MVVRRNKEKPKKIHQPLAAQSKMFIISCGFGLLLSIMVILAIWYSEYKSQRISKITDILTNEVIHGKQSPEMSQEKKLILVNGHFKINENIPDSFIKTGSWIKIHKKIEHYPWKPVRGKKPRITHSEETVKKSQFASYPGYYLFRYILHMNYLEPLTLNPEMVLSSENKIINNMLYVREQDESKEWSYRISYSVINSGPYTVIAKQIKNKLHPVSLFKGEKKKYYFAPGTKTSMDIASLVDRESGFYHFITRIYIFGFMWLAFCFILYPFHGTFNSWTFLSSWTRIAPLLLSIPACFFHILFSQQFPQVKFLSIQILIFIVFIFWFIRSNRRIRIESREEL